MLNMDIGAGLVFSSLFGFVFLCFLTVFGSSQVESIPFRRLAFCFVLFCFVFFCIADMERNEFS